MPEGCSWWLHHFREIIFSLRIFLTVDNDSTSRRTVLGAEVSWSYLSRSSTCPLHVILLQALASCALPYTILPFFSLSLPRNTAGGWKVSFGPLVPPKPMKCRAIPTPDTPSCWYLSGLPECELVHAASLPYSQFCKLSWFSLVPHSHGPTLIPDLILHVLAVMKHLTILPPGSSPSIH